MGTGKGVAAHELIMPWPIEEAQVSIKKVFENSPDMCWTDSVKKQISDCGLMMGDIFYVLKKGAICGDGELTTRRGVFKYTLVSSTPNSNGRYVSIKMACDGKRLLKILEVKITEPEG